MEIFLKAETNDDLERIIRYNIGKAHQLRKELKLLEQIPKKSQMINISTTSKNTPIEPTAEVEDTNEEYLYYYFNLLDDLSTVETEEERQLSILKNLPTIDNKNYLNIVNRIKLELLKEIHELEQLKQSETDIEFIEEIDKEKLSTQKLIQDINQVQNLKLDEDTMTATSTKNNLIFLQTHGGSTYAENDLYSISEEYYDSFKELILSIENGTFKNVKRFSKNNNILKGISEVKDFKTRVIFDRIDINTYVIIDIFVKKTDNDNGYRDSLNARVDYYKKNKAVIIEQLKDEDYITKHQKIRENLINGLTEKSIIKTMKRG